MCSVGAANVRRQLTSLRQCQSLDEVYRLADSGEHDRVINLLLPLFDADKLIDVSTAASDLYARSLLLIESFLSLSNFEVLLATDFSLCPLNHVYNEPCIVFTHHHHHVRLF